MGYHGLGAFLHDVIKKEEDIDLDMGDSNGFILGIAPDLPWYYSENIRNLTNDMFCALIAKYVKKISSSSHRKCFTAQERAAVYNKTEGHCATCGEFVPYTDFTVDHIIPLAKGGNNDLSNLQCACSVCNRIKQDILPEDLMKKLTRIMVYQVGQKGNKKYKKILRKACR